MGTEYYLYWAFEKQCLLLPQQKLVRGPDSPCETGPGLVLPSHGCLATSPENGYYMLWASHKVWSPDTIFNPDLCTNSNTDISIMVKYSINLKLWLCLYSQPLTQDNDSDNSASPWSSNEFQMIFSRMIATGKPFQDANISLKSEYTGWRQNLQRNQKSCWFGKISYREE